MRNKIDRVIKSNKFEYFLLALILILSFALRLYKIQNPVADWHSWRQADTASVSRIYLDEGIDLLRPKYHDISSIQTGYFNPEGYRFVEFPMFNLIHVVLFKTYGRFTFEVWGRLTAVIGALFTVLAVYGIGRRLWGKAHGLLAAFFYAIIPFNIYFTRVILPDPLAVTFATISVWLFLVYFQESKTKYAIASSIFFSLAMLTKPHSIFFGLPIAYMAIVKHGFRGIFKQKMLLLCIDIALVPFFLWRTWINNFLEGIPHFLWSFNGDEIRFRPSFWRWIYSERLGNLILGVWGLIPLSFGALVVDEKHKLKYFVQSLLLGMFLYTTIFATASVRHDYYQVFVIPAVALTLAQGTVYLWNKKEYNIWLRRSLVIFSIGMIINSGADKIKGFYNINHYEIVEAGMAADSLLPKDALVIAPYNGDTAFLYQTKRSGWPIVDTGIEKMIKKGASYYISVNKGDSDSVTFKRMFKTVVEADRYIILDLTSPISEK